LLNSIVLCIFTNLLLLCTFLFSPSFAAVSITDKASVIFGGSDDPTALGCLYSIGAIAQDSNGAIQAAVTDLLEPYGVAENRIYINFFDMPRANVGWSRRTFAG
jgi:phenylpyruvate tautomerase